VLSGKEQFNHWAHYHRVLAEVLDDAREGKLAPRWRQELRAYALGLPRLGALQAPRRGRMPTATDAGDDQPKALAADECLMVSGARAAVALADIDDATERRHQLCACAELDVTRRTRALWEPYAAQGDWRGALDEWYVDRIATLEQSGDIASAERRRTGGQWRGLVAQQRDVIEAKYRAGVRAGAGTDKDWREWFIGRIESWPPTDLRETLRRRMMSGDNFSAWERLPHSWMVTEP
jgi:hypothetical protein